MESSTMDFLMNANAFIPKEEKSKVEKSMD